MSTRSSFLPRLSLARADADAPILPFHEPSSPPLRRHPSEYDLSELSPRAEDALLPLSASPPSRTRRSPPSHHRSPSPSTSRPSRHGSLAGSESKSKPPPPRVLFAGPPPPIATSALLYRDEESPPSPHALAQRSPGLTAASLARTALSTVGSVLFDRSGSGSGGAHTQPSYPLAPPDPVFRTLHRREQALQADLQHLLDLQSAGLSAHLTGPPPSSSPPRSTTSSAARSTTPSSPAAHPSHPTRHVSFSSAPRPPSPVIPVRQPRHPAAPPSLPSTRALLARTMRHLAALKRDESAALSAALSARHSALARLDRLVTQRAGLAASLGASPDDPLGRELGALTRERDSVAAEVAALESALRSARHRLRALDARVADVRNRREAGLSGYRGALREVEAGVAALLARPPVAPLDGEVVAVGDTAGGDDIGGAEFLRLRPERRTVEMAREWWAGEVRVLEARRAEVERDRAALEEGVRVWREVVAVVAEFETGLREEMNGGGGGKGKGKAAATTASPAEAMRAQLAKMAGVMAQLERRLRTAEDQGWNLLICAVGAELEAFRQAETMLREALAAAGFGDDDAERDADGREGEDDDFTPRLGRSVSGKAAAAAAASSSPAELNGLHSRSGDLVDLHDDGAATESDNEVPPDLLVAHEDDHDLSPVLQHSFVARREDREDSEDEVPPEFIAEHDGDERNG